MQAKKYYPPYPLIVTNNYDCALEKAFKDAGVEFDLVYYSNPIEAREKDMFVHQKPDGSLHKIKEPNTYEDISFDQRPVILKLYGNVEQIEDGESLVITEEHYIEYLVTRDLSNLLPAKILRKLRTNKPQMLFLGYPLDNWNQRIILHRIWQELTSSQIRQRFPWWSIQQNPELLTQELWRSYGVILYEMSLKEYITELEQRIQNISKKGEAS